MAVCRATKRNGAPCTQSATDDDGYCWAHSPANAVQRRKAASRAGKAKPNREVHTLKAEVREVIAKVEGGSLDRNDATAMLQGYRVLKDLLELERRVKTTDDLAAQIAELRERIEGGRRTAF
jgi:hypothetical protein